MSVDDEIGRRPWTSEAARVRVDEIRSGSASFAAATDRLRSRIDELVAANVDTHHRRCINLNPATNVMSPRAEAVLAAGLGSRPSLGHPGDKYETGLQAIEELEVITHDVACRVFNARFAEFRVASGAMSNLYAFMACCSPGDTIIVPPPSIGGHVTHNTAGAAGLFGLDIVEAPIDAERHSVDVAGVAELARELRPTLITIGTSLNLHSHPVAELRAVADEVGARLLFDAAHACGMIAGRQWPNPLAEGAHLMTMSTYKSLGGPAGGLIVTNDTNLAQRLDAIAYPGLTANFDAARSTALAITLVDWEEHGVAYAQAMVATASALADELARLGTPVHTAGGTATTSHQFALPAAPGTGAGAGHAMALRLEQANLLACAIGLPTGEGLRLGTPEVVRWGMGEAEMPALASLIHRALTADSDEKLAAIGAEVTEFRRPFDTVGFCS